MKFSLLLTLSVLFCHLFSTAQIVIDSSPTVVDLVTNTLIGPGLSTSNITFTGNANQKGYFDGSASNIGLTNGVVLSSGDVNEIVPSGTPDVIIGGPGDADVLATAQSVTSNPAAFLITDTYDAAVLEFDFVPDGNQVVFTFVFASEEYLDWIDTEFNDAFGFYISGPNPAGGNYNVQNLALVPGTSEPITISSVHPGLNAAYYINNSGSSHSFNGFTVPINISFEVVCGETYHFKFAIADCQDQLLDSGVFLEGGSFQSTPIEMTFQTSTGDSIIYEGCNAYADVIFTRPTCQNTDTLIADLQYTGTATNGVDFTLLPDSIMFLPGQDTVILTLDPFADGLVEGSEQIVIVLTTVLPNGDTVYIDASGWIYDFPNVTVNAADTSIFCLQDSIQISALASGGVEPYSYQWNTGDTLNVTSVPANVNGVYEYYVTTTDGCGFQDMDTLTLVVNQTLVVDSVLAYPRAICDNTGMVSGFVSGATGTVNYSWSGPGNNSPNSVNLSSWQNLDSGWYYFSASDNVCVVFDSVFVDILEGPSSNFFTSGNNGCAPFVFTVTNSSVNAVQFDWILSDGNVYSTSSPNLINDTAYFSSQVYLIAYDIYGCADTSMIEIEVDICGCTNPTAINYNSTANVDDGSCYFPTPEVTAPNVFTPNGDGDNDFFELNLLNVVQLELVIVNRWGNTMFEETSSNPVWNGKVGSGEYANDGTYFYKYKATGIEGTTVEGHGFFVLIRD